MIIIATLLNSCYIHTPQDFGFNERLPLPPKIELLPMGPKLSSIDWEVSFYPLIKQMRLINEVKEDSILLVNFIKNDTNSILQSDQVTAKLSSLVNKCSNFRVVKAEVIQSARVQLGLSDKDCLESRNKAIELARYLNAQYILYCRVSGNIKQPNLEIQLMRI
ncbi:MAG: hypothetical protein MUP54_00530, partial [Candidatus Baumannia cicadellinicola]|nr:hypothetical protein [Candidatus Baumannia cicadellinicola]